MRCEPRTEYEIDIEKAVVKKAEAAGYWVVKFVVDGLRGVPDRLFIRKELDGTCRVVFIEFKRPDADPPTKQQQIRHDELRAAGAEVYWFDNVEDALACLLPY